MKKILIITFFILSTSIGITAFESDSREMKKTIPLNEITISALQYKTHTTENACHLLKR